MLFSRIESRALVDESKSLETNSGKKDGNIHLKFSRLDIYVEIKNPTQSSYFNR